MGKDIVWLIHRIDDILVFLKTGYLMRKHSKEKIILALKKMVRKTL